MYRFKLEHTCAQSGARAGTIETAHGTIHTPIFMPVGTQAAIKSAVRPRDLHDAGVQIILSNTYHLMIRPGRERLRDLGGLHKFMSWDRPILTDSGGFQVYSLSRTRKVTDEGAVFQSHIDGERFKLDAETAIGLQEDFGSDIAMAFDECPPAKAERPVVVQAMRRTTAWLDRCIAARRRPDEVALYGIVQGGIDKQLRAQHVDEICSRDCEGFAIGGLSVGESIDTMYEVCAATAALMPKDKARYLMGVGKPADLLTCIGMGIDQFDCVLPSRNARHGKVFTLDGGFYIKNTRFRGDDRPLDPAGDYSPVGHFSRAYVRHLWSSGEALGAHIMTLHNLAFYLYLSRQARLAILQDRYTTWSQQLLARMATEKWKRWAQEKTSP
jgi:queuine tRNA-ribosyltransferase